MFEIFGGNSKLYCPEKNPSRATVQKHIVCSEFIFSSSRCYFAADFKWRGSKGNWDEGIVWRGAVTMGKPKGKGTLVFPASDKLRNFAEGVMEAGRMQGQWVFKFRNGMSHTYDSWMMKWSKSLALP